MKLLVLCLSLALVSATPIRKPAAGPVKVTVRQLNGKYELLRAGKPYFVRGAGGSQYPERIAAYGGNSIRTWSTSGADNVLAAARANGLTVMLGLDVARERHGFDYNDAAAVAAQLQKIKAEVLKYKDDPAVLLWGIGNELNLDYTNPKVWDAVNGIAQMIHEVDPNHPTSTVLAGANAKEIEYVKTRCPAVDILSINTYAGLPALPRQVKAAGWTGPYLVAEWGPTGHWECALTPWKAPVEETSSQKAAVYQSRYEAAVATDKQCLGSYVFLWGQKQERTPTWYGLFTEDGQETEVMDVLQYEWSGHWPQNRAPHIAALKLLAGSAAADYPTVKPGTTVSVQSSIADPDGDYLSYQWELLPESTDLKQGGDRESRPATLPLAMSSDKLGHGWFAAPDRPGAYRLFVYAHDGHGNVATGNVPFLVQP